MNNIFYQISRFCHKNLLSNNDILSYLYCRGIRKKTIKKFELGYFPNDLRDLFDSIDPVKLRESGIIYNASDSRFSSHNLIFPIRDLYGEHIAIAGRTILSETDMKKRKYSKYTNTQYPKKNHLYGLNYAKNEIFRKKCVYVVEGYFDVITPFQNGLTNIVAVCGKYLSVRQISLLGRYTKNIVLMFDNEEEAQNRAKLIRDFRQFDGINIHVINPLRGMEYKDIDEFLLNEDIEDLRGLNA